MEVETPLRMEETRSVGFVLRNERHWHNGVLPRKDVSMLCNCVVGAV